MQTLLQDLRYGARMLLKQPGFSYERLWSANITLPEKKYSVEQRIEFWQRLTERLRAVPAAIHCRHDFVSCGSAGGLLDSGAAGGEG